MITFNGKKVDIKTKKGRIKDILKELDVVEEEVVILKNDKVVFGREKFNERDKIVILSVGSRG